MIRFLLLASGILALGQTIQFSAVSQDVIEKRVGAYTAKNATRQPAVRRLFEEAGCGAEKLTEQSVKGLKPTNLICNMPGAMPSTIVVGAHFDLEEKGDGVVDNWTGAALLPSLYEGLAGVPRRHTFRFVAFSAEERGLLGSKAYVAELGKSHEVVTAMVNLDTLGLSESEVWVRRRG